MREFSLLVFVGRFQPFHLGHRYVVEQALALADHVLLLCGSSFQSPTLRNPWDFFTRKNMILASLDTKIHDRMMIEPIQDIMYQDEKWVEQIQAKVAESVAGLNLTKRDKIGFIGHMKDSSSYYLNLFPGFDLIQVDNLKKINGTAIRRACFEGDIDSELMNLVPEVVPLLQVSMQTKEWRSLLETYQYVDEYQKSWASSPYPPILVTVDVMVEHNQSLLLIERGGQPGKGFLALPGGFIDAAEKLTAACWRELQEETSLAVEFEQFEQYYQDGEVFDHPNRSDLGRVISHVRYYKLPEDQPRPKVTAGDDAARVLWHPIKDLDGSVIFSDHYFIIQKLLK